MIPTTNPNLRYCLQFLRNGGERLRAIRLCRDVTGLTFAKAIQFVDGLHEPSGLDSNRELKKFCGSCRVELLPDTPCCPTCGNPFLLMIVPGKPKQT